MKGLIAAISGLLFGFGMVLSGMVLPEKVLGFLDITGMWDISLAFVMGGALLVFIPSYFFWLKHRPMPLFAESFSLPTRFQVDLKLIMGAVLFGVGWGIAGICPGPAVASLSFATQEMWLFFLSMITGFFLFRWCSSAPHR